MINGNHKILELNYLMEVTSHISKAKKFEDISEIIFDFIENLIKYDLAVIYNLDEDNKDLKVVSCRGVNIERLKARTHFKIGEGVVGWVAKEKKILLIDDVLKSKEFNVRQTSEDPTISSFLSVPFIVGDKVIGILSVSCTRSCQFKIRDIQMISIIASQCAALLELNNEINQAQSFSSYILDNMNKGVIVTDKNNNIINFNKAAEKITEYDFDEMIMRNIFRTPFIRPILKKQLSNCLKIGKSYEDQKSFLTNKSGDVFTIKYSISEIKDQNGRFDGFILIFNDNTENEKLQKQIITAEKLSVVGRLTSGITHEIRNPLLPIMTASEFLISSFDEKCNDSEVIKLLGIIHSESKRLNKFLDQFSVMDEKNRVKNNKGLVVKALEDTLILLEQSLKKDNILLLKDYPEEDFYVSLSMDQLKQIFLNIMLNGVDAIKERDRSSYVEDSITVYISKNNKNGIIRIINTGEPITNKNINKIFDPFYSTKEDGTGLGLAIVNNLLLECGGEISVSSCFDKETEFLLKIPLYI